MHQRGPRPHPHRIRIAPANSPRIRLRHTVALQVIAVRSRLVVGGRTTETESLIPALSRDWLTGFYDPVVRLTTRERAFKQRLLEAADPGARGSILDVGCGTGTFAISAKRAHPELRVVGLDADPKILGTARRKTERAGCEVELVQAGLTPRVPRSGLGASRPGSDLSPHTMAFQIGDLQAGGEDVLLRAPVDLGPDQAPHQRGQPIGEPSEHSVPWPHVLQQEHHPVGLDHAPCLRETADWIRDRAEDARCGDRVEGRVRKGKPLHVGASKRSYPAAMRS